MYNSDLAACVARSAQLLDDYRPGWAAKIDTSMLDVASISTCPLGQTFREEDRVPFSYGLNLLGFGGPNPIRHNHKDYAFWDDGPVSNAKINALWLQEVALRL